MKILPTWLREFVDISADDRQLANDLTAAGIAVEGYSTEGAQTVYEIEITPNRVDAMSHYGVAREAAAIYDRELKAIQPKPPKELPAEGGRTTQGGRATQIPSSGTDDRRPTADL